MEELRRTAIELGCSRVDWTADADNPGAQRFYARLGVPPLPSKIYYRDLLPAPGPRRLRDETPDPPGETGDSPQ